MAKLPIKSARGVYYDLSVSPYTFAVCGDIFRFSSKKRLEIFTREYERRMKSVERNYKQLSKILTKEFNMYFNDKIDLAKKLYQEVER